MVAINAAVYILLAYLVQGHAFFKYEKCTAYIITEIRDRYVFCADMIKILRS